MALGLDETDANRQNLEVYREAFEKPFLASTELYYQAESQRFIGDNSVTEYMKKAEMRLSEEENRVDMYLHASTRKSVSLIPLHSRCIPRRIDPSTLAPRLARQQVRGSARAESLGIDAGGVSTCESLDPVDSPSLSPRAEC